MSRALHKEAYGACSWQHQEIAAASSHTFDTGIVYGLLVCNMGAVEATVAMKVNGQTLGCRKLAASEGDEIYFCGRGIRCEAGFEVEITGANVSVTVIGNTI